MKTIPVTKTFLPPKEEYLQYLNRAWDKEWITNNGELVQELEARLLEYLQLPFMSYVTNGTIALQLAIKALGLKGEIITTPFSYVATTSSIVWEGCRPVFVDIDSETFNIDPNKIEEAITSKTSAILATHVYGNPCDIDAIHKIAKKHNLKVIYDAAHAFGTRYKGKSVFAFGDVSTCSFHATKLFHTVEGGAIFCNEEKLWKRVRYMRNFGHDGPENFNGVGINGKNSEFHAAMGLANLKYIDAIQSKRKEQWLNYKARLDSKSLQLLKIQPECSFNFAYFPVVFENEECLLMVEKVLKSHGIYPRRYFYPLLSSLEYIDSRSKLEIANRLAPRVLCLPLYHNIDLNEIRLVCDIINH